jgi:glycosyltransferase involved in cell wall biosynthesis
VAYRLAENSMTSLPRISIGLPVYNGERFLSAAVDSLLAQTYENFELILADNASTDATSDICRTYGALDRRIQYVRNESNIGVYRNCNKVIGLSKGEYFKLACADDVCHPDLLAKCVETLDSDASIVAAYPKTRFIAEDGKWLALSDPGWHLMADSRVERMRHVIASGHWVNLFYGLTRSRDLAQTRLFPHYAGGDCSLLGELCLRGRFFEIPEYLFFRRIHPKAASQNPDLEWQSLQFKGRSGRVELPFWHICLDHCRTILSSDLTSRHKLACLNMVGQRMISGKRALFNELQTAWKYFCTVKPFTSR